MKQSDWYGIAGTICAAQASPAMAGVVSIMCLVFAISLLVKEHKP